MPEVSAQGDASQPNLEYLSPVVGRFFEAFALGDWQSMARCYHDKASFSDPVYPDLREERIVYMWHQLLAAATTAESKGSSNNALCLNNLQLEYKVLFGDERKAQVQWFATYQYGKRPVRNEVLSTLAIWDDKIVRQVDEFNFWRWSRQARGLPGLAFGAMPWYQRSVQRSAQSRLEQAAGTIGA
jgi:hypothetical protein